MTKSEAVLFVQGIPLDLDQRGLVNIFARAGPVENAKVIPANNPTYSSTYGFVSFTNKTSAATALEMFNNYKIGNKYLNVSYANQSKTPTRNDENRNKDIRSVLNSSRPQSRLSNESDAHSRKSSIGRGTIIHQNSERNGGNRVKRGNFDLSRPFARKILSRSNIINVNSNINNNNANDSFMFSDVEYQKYESESRAINGSNSKTSKEMSKIVNNEILGIERLKIDELYPVYLTHVNTPSNFFVQLIESKEKTANLMNNLDNYYRNGLHEENGAHLKESNNISFEIDDLCAAYYDSFWYRAKIVHKSLSSEKKRTFHLRIIDFGDVQEIPYENVKILSQEFCQTRPASIRCKLANVRPPKGNKQWCQKAYDTLDTLFKLKETLFIKVMGIEEFEPSSGRFESIYAVDLIYNFSESILSYFIQNGLGIENDDVDDVDFDEKHGSLLDLYFRGDIDNDKKDNEVYQQIVSVDNDDEIIDDFYQFNLTSVSVSNIYEKNKIDNLEYPKSLTEANNRSKLFNSVFRVFKKKDLNPSIQMYKCGQVFDVNVSYIDDCLEFYVQPLSKLPDMHHLEKCIQKYANVLLNDDNLKEELKVFQEKTSRFDVVIAKIDDTWKRAVFLERSSTASLYSMFDDDCEKMPTATLKYYFCFFLIDTGREVLVTQEKNRNELFILPFDEKLIQIGSFALKCKISDHQIKLRDTCFSSGRTQEKINLRKKLFDKKFKTCFENKNLRVRISQIVTLKNEMNATVDLYFIPESDSIETKTNIADLNCIKHILDNIKHQKEIIKSELNYEEKQSDEIELKIKQNDSQENQKIKLGEGIFKPLEQQQQQQQQVPKSLSSQQLIQSSKSIDTKKEEEKEKQKQQDFLHVVCERTSLITSHSYNVNLQYYDENRLDPFFYVCLTDDFSKLELLDAELQKISTDSSKFKYVEKMSDLKLNDTLEALYEVDSKWYRVQISKISENDKTIEIYFLDYGNSEKLQALVPKTLRFRRKYDSQNELDLFKLKYQAIKCCYKSKTENDSINCFIEKLTNMENIEDGFNIYIKQFIQNENLHVVVFDDEIELLEADREVRNIIESSQGPVQSNNDTELIEQVNDDNLIKASCQDIQFEMNAILKSTFVVHVESVGEFYVQSSDTYEKTIEFQEKIQQLIDALIKFNRSSSTSKPKHSFNVGDFVFGKFLPDSNWYRAIIIKKQQQKSDNNQQDFLYDVYFVDYGNKQENLTSDNLYSFEYVYGLNKSLNFMPQEDLHIIINHPFQAICCKLMDKKETTQNNQILESLVREYLNFDISIIKVEKVKLFNEIVELNKYLVSIGTDQIIGSEGKPLNDLFESIESITNVIKQESSDNSSKSTNPLPPPPQQQQQQQQNPSPVEEKKVFDQQKLEINKFYECKLAALEKEIFANLIEHTDLFAQLESEINADQTIESKYWKCQPEVGDFVLAKFYADESNYSWCRALIVDKSYSVYYFDYGNFGSSITLSDLAPLKSKYDLNAYPPFAFKLILNKVNLDLDTHGHLLAEFLEDKFSVKIKSIESDNLNDDKIKTINFNKYYVEMWDLKKTKCLNKLIDDSYSTTTNTTTTSVEYEPKNEQNTLESEPSKKEPTEIESQEIQKTSFSKLFSSKKTNQLKANVKYIFMDDLVKPFYFCLKTDFDLRNSLDNELNRFYLNQNRESVGDKLDINSYVAVFSESSWFRAQIKSSHLTDTTKTITLFYVDYGYDETIQLDNDNLDRLKKLDAKFYKYPRYAFGASLVNSNESKSDSYEMMNFENKDNDLLADTLKEYFENNSSYDESSLVVVSKLDQNDNLNDEYFYTNEEYYGIMMYNEKDMCLNEMIEKIKTSKKITKKPTRPNSLRLFRDILPKQNPKSDKYCIFARSLDLFYVYNELNVIKVQQDVQLICEKIMQQQNDYELDDENDKPDLNNLVYAKYDDDETWYRCLVTNCDKQKSKYELFYIDFGNTEIIDSKDILIGWSKEHMKPFTDYEAQALKCSLYELRPTNSKTEFTEEDKIKFKQFISDKVFIVNFLRYNQNGNLYDVSLEIDSTQTTDNKSSSAHIFSLREKIAKFSNFDEILITKRTKEENEFLKNLIDRFENC